MRKIIMEGPTSAEGSGAEKPRDMGLACLHSSSAYTNHLQTIESL